MRALVRWGVGCAKVTEAKCAPSIKEPSNDSGTRDLCFTTTAIYGVASPLGEVHASRRTILAELNTGSSTLSPTRAQVSNL